MFGFLKEKLKSTIKGIADKFKQKPSEEPKEAIKEEQEREIKKKKEKRIEEIKEKAKEESKGFFQKLRDLGKSRLDEEDFCEFFKQLEFTLMENNVALEVIDAIKSRLKQDLLNVPLLNKEIEEKIKEALRNALNEILIEPFDIIEKAKLKKPFIMAFFGINGSGKTTTIAKIANLLKKSHLSCVLAASDTFRAASIEQLQKHADVLGIKLVRHQYNADPAAVAFDAIAYAKSHSIDVVLIDTAGRMHTSSNLMKEMEKIVRVSKPDLKIFVGEAIIGNDAIEQAKSFNESIGIDGIILCKSDVDEKGGASISIGYITRKPILFLGIGQNYNDLERFNKDKIIKSLGL